MTTSILLFSIIAIVVLFFVFFIIVKEEVFAQDNCEQTKLKDFTFMSIEEYENLLSDPQAEVAKVLIKDRNDISIIHNIGVIIITQEPQYLLITGDLKKINKIKTLFSVREPRETDYRMRPIRVWIENSKQIEELSRAGVDIWPIEHLPGYIYGGAFDCTIKWLQSRDYRIKLGHN